MKKHLLFILFSACSLFAIGQKTPIDFEASGNGAEWTWRTFENLNNPPLEIVSNPDSTGLNSSSTVAKFTALRGGQPFAGCESMHGADIGTFTVDASTSTIRIMVWKSVISNIGIKLVRADNWSLGEIKVANTLVNQWEQLEFDFSEHLGLTYDQIVIFPDFNTRQADNVIFFDNIFGDIALSATSNLADEAMTLSPNLVTDFLTVNFVGTLNNYEIYSMGGRLFDSVQYLTDVATIEISHLPIGIYFFITHHQGQIISKKFIKI